MTGHIISIDIVHYLWGQGFSNKEIADKAGISIEIIDRILKKKQYFTQSQIENIVKDSGLKTWEFIYRAIPSSHLPENIKERIEICKTLSDRIRKGKN